MNPETRQSTSKIGVDLDDFFEQIGLDIASQVRAQLEQGGPVDPKKLSGSYVVVGVTSEVLRKAIIQIYQFSDPKIAASPEWLRSIVDEREICEMLPEADPMVVKTILDRLKKPTRKAILMIYNEWKTVLESSGSDPAYELMKNRYDLDDVQMDILKDYINALMGVCV